MIEEDKLVTFNLPRYAPSMEEVKAVIHGDGLFDVEEAQALDISSNTKERCPPWAVNHHLVDYIQSPGA